MQKQHVDLSGTDRNALTVLTSSGTMKARGFKRAQALLYLDSGKTYVEVAGLLSVGYMTVCRWAKAYKANGLSFLKDQPRSGRPIRIDMTAQARVTALACSQTPEGYSQWSLRLLSDRCVELNLVEQVSHTTVSKILKKTSCNPIANGSGASGS